VAACRDLAVRWRVLDVSHNAFGRDDSNAVFWALRQNRHLRVYRAGHTHMGPKFGCDDDALLSLGISIVKCLKFNVMLRELDLSGNRLVSNAGNNILDALIDNHSIHRLVWALGCLVFCDLVFLVRVFLACGCC
jgi:hypothetical protein